jgi:hypothetical protein
MEDSPAKRRQRLLQAAQQRIDRLVGLHELNRGFKPSPEQDAQ